MAAKSTMTFIGEPDVSRMLQALVLLIGKNAGVELTAKTVRKKTPEEIRNEKNTRRVALLEVTR